MFFLWVWEKIVGLNEYRLRLGNAPWFLLGFVPFCRNRLALAIVTATSGFVWYYLDEARPYAMQVGATLLLFAGAREWLKEETNSKPALWPRLAVAAGLVLLSTSSLLGMIWAGAAVLTIATLFGFHRLVMQLRMQPMLWLLVAIVLAITAGYYLWTLKQGARATTAAGTDLRNVFYALYELLGVSGLGPGRLEIRNEGLPSFKNFAWPLMLYAAVVTIIAFTGIRALVRSTPRREAITIPIGVAVALIFLFAVGYITHFRLLARHLTPALVIWFVVAAEGVEVLWRRGRFGRTLTLGFILLGTISGLELRFAHRHARDDYRGAAAVAHSAATAGQKVWWSADPNGASYYGVSGANVTFVANRSAEQLRALPEPELVIVSKPDLYDNYGAVREYLNGHSYRRTSELPAFTIWGKNP